MLLETIPMGMPSYEQLMLPLLKLLADGKERRVIEVEAMLADSLGLTVEERLARTPTGTKTVLYDRVAWAKTYLAQAGLIDSPRRGVHRISESGMKLLKTNPKELDTKFLKARYPGMQAFLERSKQSGKQNVVDGVAEAETGSKESPENLIAGAQSQLRALLVGDLLSQLQKITPEQFERLVVKLLVRLGYGESEASIIRATGYSNDGGIDGVIQEDKLGLDMLYVQAKRYKDGSNIGREAIQQFVGALHGVGANRGVFITRSDFKQTALDYVKGLGVKVVLINGEKLANLMIDYNLGVSITSTVEIKKTDGDFFDEL
jgi:restriction system protein